MSSLRDEKWGAERDASEMIVRRERGCGKLKSTEKRLMNKHSKYKYNWNWGHKFGWLCKHIQRCCCFFLENY